MGGPFESITDRSQVTVGHWWGGNTPCSRSCPFPHTRMVGTVIPISSLCLAGNCYCQISDCLWSLIKGPVRKGEDVKAPKDRRDPGRWEVAMRQMEVSSLGRKAHSMWCLFLLSASSTPSAPQPKDPLDCFAIWSHPFPNLHVSLSS